MQTAYIIDAVRTPIGKYGGALSAIRPDDLLAVVIKALTARNPSVDVAAIDLRQILSARHVVGVVVAPPIPCAAARRARNAR